WAACIIIGFYQGTVDSAGVDLHCKHCQDARRHSKCPIEGASEVMTAGLKRAAEVKTPSICIAAGQREACGKIWQVCLSRVS
uniref:Uncharacterized protein n=1 Tax=Sinocyclocheilus anshuiensis TaxID=1608454 RepID=A0A671PVL7_9TELE